MKSLLTNVLTILSIMTSISVHSMQDNKHIFWATGEGFGHAIESFIEAGRNINISDEKGWTLLHHTSKCMDMRIMEMLFENGATMSTNDDGDTLMHLFVKSRNDCHEQIKLCLDFFPGAINIENKSEKKPIHYAIENNQFLTVKALLAHTKEKDDVRELPIHLAKGNSKILTLLARKMLNLSQKRWDLSRLLTYARKVENIPVTRALESITDEAAKKNRFFPKKNNKNNKGHERKKTNKRINKKKKGKSNKKIDSPKEESVKKNESKEYVEENENKAKECFEREIIENLFIKTPDHFNICAVFSPCKEYLESSSFTLEINIERKRRIPTILRFADDPNDVSVHITIDFDYYLPWMNKLSQLVNEKIKENDSSDKYLPLLDFFQERLAEIHQNKQLNRSLEFIFEGDKVYFDSKVTKKSLKDPFKLSMEKDGTTADLEAIIPFPNPSSK